MQATVRRQVVHNQDESLRLLAGMIQRGIGDPMIRACAMDIVNRCESRDDRCELGAIYDAVKKGDARLAKWGLRKGVRYSADPSTTDFFTSGRKTLEQCQLGACGGDCLPNDTLVVGAGFVLRSISEVQPGDVIMGDGAWTTVTAAWDKGIQRILEFSLSNGCVLRCTAEHRLFRVPRNGAGNAGDRALAEEVRAGDIRPGDDLLTPAALPFGVESLDPERAWLLGVHVADGWVGHDVDRHGRAVVRRVAISGKDGHRKEAQKARVRAYCEAHGLAYRWDTRYITINDVATAEWLAGCGRRALNKHLPSLNWAAPVVAALLEGLSADAEQRDGVFGTISPMLALQYRLLLRMQGVSAHIARVEDHGGFGKHAIYRVSPRHGGERADPRKFARVRSIAEGDEEPTTDIEVEGHRFYLPESDLVVHNCDDHTVLLASLAGSIGFTVGARAYAGPNDDDFVHVYAVAGVPKRAPRQYLGMDTTVREAELGWEPPPGRVRTIVIGPEAG